MKGSSFFPSAMFSAEDAQQQRVETLRWPVSYVSPRVTSNFFDSSYPGPSRISICRLDHTSAFRFQGGLAVLSGCANCSASPCAPLRPCTLLRAGVSLINLLASLSVGSWHQPAGFEFRVCVSRLILLWASGMPPQQHPSQCKELKKCSKKALPHVSQKFF